MSSFPGFFVNMIKGFQVFGIVRLSLTSCTSEAVIPPNLVLKSFCKLWVFLSNPDYYPCAPIVDSHPDDWAKFVQDVIRNKLYKGTVLSRFPYQEGILNEWFLENNPEGQDELPNRTINILNLTEIPESYPELDGTVFPPSDRQDGHRILCQGTNHESARNVLEEGIRLDKLDKYTDQDFSCGKGFYLTTFEMAVDWAFNKSGTRTKRAAILLFKIPNDVIERFETKSLNLVGESKEQRWRDVLTNIKTESKGKSFIQGPWMDGPKSARIGRRVPNQQSYQMCLLSRELVDEFDRNLHSIVFYNIEQ